MYPKGRQDPKGRQETYFLAQCLEDFEGSTASGTAVKLDMRKEKLWRSWNWKKETNLKQNETQSAHAESAHTQQD